MTASDIISIIFEVVPVVVTAASAIAAITPTPRDDRFMRKVYRFLIDMPALNFGRAKER